MITARYSSSGLALALLAALPGCDRQGAPAPEASETADMLPASPSPSATSSEPSKSIIRPDVEAAPIAPPPLEPVELTVTFDDKSNKPNETDLGEIDRMMASPTFAAGGPIILRGHSDSVGSDRVNLAASKKRAEAVRNFLKEKGVAPDRMTVIALGEGRPVAPNRKLDGTDDPEGRAKNRRVEILVQPPAADTADIEPAGDKETAPET